MNNSSIGKRIQYLRYLHNNMTQADLGKAISVSRNVIAKWENEERDIKAENLIALADYFDVSVDYILGRTDIQEVDPTISKIAKMTGLSAESLFCLRQASGDLINSRKKKSSDYEPAEDSEEFLELINIIIPNLQYSVLLRNFYNLLSIYKSPRVFDYADTKGDWLEEKGTSYVLTTWNGEAVNYLLYGLGNEFKSMVQYALNEKYGSHTERSDYQAPQDNPTSNDK